MREALGLEHSRREIYPEAAIARTKFHLSQVLRDQDKNLEEAEELRKSAYEVLVKLLALNPLPAAPEGDQLALYDHIQPVFDGRFTGRSYLQYVM